MRWPTEVLAKAVLGVGLLILLLIVALSYLSVTGLVKNAGWVQETYAVVTKLERVDGSIEHAKADTYRYIMTGEGKVVEEYGVDSAAVLQALGDMKELAADDPSRLVRLDAVQRGVDAELRLLKEAIDLRREKGIQAAADLLQAPRATEITDSLDQAIEQMESAEGQLLIHKDEQQDSSAERTIVMITLGGLTAFFIAVLAVLALSRDIARRKQLEESLRESEERLRLLVSNSPDLMYHQDRGLRYTWIVNAPWSNQALGKTDLEILGPKEAERATRIKRKVLGTGVGTRAEVHLSTGGEERYYDSVYEPHTDRYGRVVGLFGYARDITERKRLEEQLFRAQRLEAAGRVAAQVAHEFNNLLGPLTAYPQLIKMRLPQGHPGLQYCDAMQEAAMLMANINEDMMTLGRRGLLEEQLVDLNHLVKQSVEPATGRPNTLVIELALAPEILSIKGSSGQLSRVITNLVANAREAMGDVGVLTIKTENVYVDEPGGHYNRVEVGEYVRLQVSDTGPGIPPEVKSKIFDAFFSTKRTKGRYGSGLGLAVVQAIVSDHRGYIDLESEVGKRTTFSVYLPAYRDGVIQTPAEGHRDAPVPVAGVLTFAGDVL